MKDVGKYPGTFDGMMDLVGTLRSPEGCPWDLKQTRQSLKRYLLAECYELVEAMDNEDIPAIVEELGDMLFQMAFHMRIGLECSEFTPEQVFKTQIQKMISRHPHVFGDTNVADAAGVEVQWQSLKRKERSNEGTSIMDGIPGSLPSLATAQMLRDRAAGSGFDWEDIDGVLSKMREEVDEFKAARSKEERETEMGDMLFTLVNISSWVGVDAEGALRASNNRFRKRYIHMEQLCKEKGLVFEKLTLDQKEALWQEAKKLTEE